LEDVFASRLCVESARNSQDGGAAARGAGSSNAELKALSDAMATLYTREADKKKLAEGAAEKLKVNNLYPHHASRYGNDAK
jgi:hypothetical protein